MIKPFNADPFAFFYCVEKEGYDWISGRLVGLGAVGSPVELKELQGGVFLEFAGLTPDADHVRQFANQYGDLFAEHDWSTLVPHRDTLKGGSTLKAWAAEIADMQVLVDIWRATEFQEHRKELKKIIKWNGKEVMYSITTPRRAMPLAWLNASHFRPSDILMPARYALQAEINRRLKEPEMTTTPRLVWTHERKRDVPLHERYQRLIFRPPNLLAALWLQFAQTLARKYQLAECVECHRLFIAGPGSGKRSDAETCTNACRQRRFARKQESLR